MAKSLPFLALFLIFTSFGLGVSPAAEKVWIGLYLAENAPPPPEAKLAPEKLHHRLHEVFGFKYYRLIKAQEFDIRKEWEQWFVPRKDFFLSMRPLRHEPGEPGIIEYEIYKDGFIVATGKYEPHEDTPLFINGPDFHDGRLIFVLEAR
jgi:hypothetical protein